MTTLTVAVPVQYATLAHRGDTPLSVLEPLGYCLN